MSQRVPPWQKTTHGGHKEQKSIFSRFWRLDVQDQGSRRFGFCWELSSWFAHGHLAPLLTWPFLSASVQKEESSSGSPLPRTMMLSDQGSPLWPHKTLSTSLETLPPNTATMRRGFQHRKFGDTNIQCIALLYVQAISLLHISLSKIKSYVHKAPYTNGDSCFIHNPSKRNCANVLQLMYGFPSAGTSKQLHITQQ